MISSNLEYSQYANLADPDNFLRGAQDYIPSFTLWDYFQKKVTEQPEWNFLGVKMIGHDDLPASKFKWTSYREGAHVVDLITSGYHEINRIAQSKTSGKLLGTSLDWIAPERTYIDQDGVWRIMAFFSENRPEYLLS